MYPKPSYLEPRYTPMRSAKANMGKKLNISEDTDSDTESYQSKISESSESTSSISSAASQKDTISVYLRLRPTDEIFNMSQYRVENNILKVKTQNTESIEKHYTFTKVFNDAVRQSSLYNEIIYPVIASEENSTILTYGTSGSGKTFTLLGDNNQPGIAPRALEQIFTEYGNNICQDPIVKYEKGSIGFLDDHRILKEENFRQSFLAEADFCVEESFHSTRKTILAESQFKTKDLKDAIVFVWISFAEIYNESVFDLLNPSVEHDKENKRLKNRLKIISNDGHAFIKDITSVFVTNSEDAYKLLRYGMHKLSVSSTAVNSNSSRSHCIFSIDVITLFHNQLTVVTHRLCDLAGSERLKKTDNIGNRLKEAQQINTSLMVLGRCLTAIHQEQQHKGAHQVIPYRESKLTMLLQRSLLGREKLTMIVNLMPDNMYMDENINVLNFSAIARQIVQQSHEVSKKKCRTSTYSLFVSHVTSSPKRGLSNLMDSELIIEE